MYLARATIHNNYSHSILSLYSQWSVDDTTYIVQVHVTAVSQAKPVGVVCEWGNSLGSCNIRKSVYSVECHLNSELCLGVEYTFSLGLRYLLIFPSLPIGLHMQLCFAKAVPLCCSYSCLISPLHMQRMAAASSYRLQDSHRETFGRKLPT